MPVSTVFEDFVSDAEPRLRRALIARHGVDEGREATVDALVYAWTHWERVAAMDNPVGYLYRVGGSAVCHAKQRPALSPTAARSEPWVEPKLEPGLQTLSEPQRTAVVLRHSFEWTYGEIAELLDISVSTVRNHLARGMEKLRDVLEVKAHG